MSVDLVIFDCDGVLVDSEIISCRVYAQALSRYGYPITADQVHDRFLGRSSRETRLEVECELGRMLPDDFQAQLNAELFGELETSLEPMPHIDEALDAILQPVCVASSGPLQKISVSLNRVGLTERFAPHIFSATQVNRGKPAPDLFLYAAMQMGAEPSRCLVVEDSVAGVTAARAAGMVALGFAGGSHCRPGHGESLRHAGAQASFVDMRQLYDIISQF